MKAHAEEEGRPMTCHEKENKRADEDAEVAYGCPDTLEYRK